MHLFKLWCAYIFGSFVLCYFEIKLLRFCPLGRWHKKIILPLLSSFSSNPLTSLYAFRRFTCKSVSFHCGGSSSRKTVPFKWDDWLTVVWCTNLSSCLGCLSCWIDENERLPSVLLSYATPVFLRIGVLMAHRNCWETVEAGHSRCRQHRLLACERAATKL